MVPGTPHLSDVVPRCKVCAVPHSVRAASLWPLGISASMAGQGGMWVFYYLQGEDGDSVENPNAFNVRDGQKRDFPRCCAQDRKEGYLVGGGKASGEDVESLSTFPSTVFVCV